MDKGHRVVTRIDRPAQQIVAGLAAFEAVDIADTMKHSGSVLGLRSVFDPPLPACGPAVTLSVTVPNIDMLRVALQLCQPGDVLVINARGNTGQAVLGGFMGHALRNRGVAGVVVDGAVRDPLEFGVIGLPVYARAATSNGAALSASGEINVPVACGGAVVNPGDIVVADGTGIAVVPADLGEQVAVAAQALVDLHETWKPEVARGEIFGLSGSLERVTGSGCAFDAPLVLAAGGVGHA